MVRSFHLADDLALIRADTASGSLTIYADELTGKERRRALDLAREHIADGEGVVVLWKRDLRERLFIGARLIAAAAVGLLCLDGLGDAIAAGNPAYLIPLLPLIAK